MNRKSVSGTPSSVAEVIAAEGGRVPFARFMEIALTHPTLGYYSRVERLLWYGGDFVTAPAISPFFNRTLARLVTELVDAALAAGTGPVLSTDDLGTDGAKPCVVELGGGEGQLTQAILHHWESERPEFRDTIGYRIVEVGPRLRQRQAAVLGEQSAAGWNLAWGADLEEACADARPVVIVANEFLDALPVHVIDTRGTALREEYVVAARSVLSQEWGEVSDAAAGELELLFGTLDPRVLQTFTEDGALEICPGLADLMRRVEGIMPSGSLVNVDYGEWFPGVDGTPGQWELEGRKQRRRTVRGYFQHQMVLDPLVRPGRQDLTADVDFAAFDLHGRRRGFETVLYATLAGFLRGGGAEEELAALRGTARDARLDPLEADRQATVLANLLDDQDLGDAFKVMVQVRE